MIAVIGEKPSVARDIARILGASEKQDGYLSGNGYLVTWAFGHLVGLAMPEAYGIQSFRRESLPIIPDSFQLTPRQVKAEKGYKADPGALKQLKVIKEVFDQSDKIIVATDAGREGELIFRYIYQYIGCNKPFVRLWISSLTDKSIREGLQNLKAGSLYDNLFLSAQACSEADYLIGINGTQALSVAAGQGIFSLGRVQSPTLAMICTRFLENKNFVLQKYWQLKLQTTKDNVTFTALSTEKYDKQQPAIDTLPRIKEAKTVQVKTVERKEVNQEPPLLYDLTTLQKEVNTKLNFSADKTLSIAQKLYEGNYVVEIIMLRNNRNYLLYTILAIANNNIIEKVEVKILNSTFLLFLIKKVATLLVQGACFSLLSQSCFYRLIIPVISSILVITHSCVSSNIFYCIWTFGLIYCCCII